MRVRTVRDSHLAPFVPLLEAAAAVAAAAGGGPRDRLGNTARQLRKAIRFLLQPKSIAAAGIIFGLGLAGLDAYRFYTSSISDDITRKWKELISGEAGHNPVMSSASCEPTTILDCKGEKIATVTGNVVALADCADCVWQSIVASEDHRFFQHHGVDIRGLSRAVLSMGKSGGGSTITQQLVKNLLLSQSRTISRKVVEMGLAVALECKLSKPEMLEIYMNNVYLGHGIYGVAGASAAYFRKKPIDLEPGEAALLAALLPSPEYLSPLRNPEESLRARNQVLVRMVQSGYLSEVEAEEEIARGLPASLFQDDPDVPKDERKGAMASPLYHSANPYKAPYFVNEVLFKLKELFGEDVLTRMGGLEITTTLDLELQEEAERLMLEDKKIHGEDAAEAALVALEPQTGAIKALQGGRDYNTSPYNRAMLATRSPGSAFKPLVYLAALAYGAITPSTELVDEPVAFDTEDFYIPQNFSRKFRGKVTVKESLIQSLNIPTVKIASMVGIDRVVALSHRLGIDTSLPHTLSLALGGCEVTPFELATAYNSIAANGMYSRPYMISEIKDRDGKVIYKHKPARRQAANAESCKQLAKILKSVLKDGTGREVLRQWKGTPSSARLLAGKTGTSDEFRDGWFAGFSPSLCAVVWVGHDNNGPLNGSGATMAAPLWSKFMSAYHGGLEAKRKEREAIEKLKKKREARDKEKEAEDARGRREALLAPRLPERPVRQL